MMVPGKKKKIVMEFSLLGKNLCFSFFDPKFGFESIKFKTIKKNKNRGKFLFTWYYHGCKLFQGGNEGCGLRTNVKPVPHGSALN